MDEARALIDGPLWERVRDRFVETGEFEVFPRGDRRRLAWLDEDERRTIERWLEALGHIAEWRHVVSGEKVRVLQRDYEGVYPEILRYEPYFVQCGGDDAAVFAKLLKIRFPQAYRLCFET